MFFCHVEYFYSLMDLQVKFVRKLWFFRKRNHYDVLDIPYDATDEEIKNAFVKRSQEVGIKVFIFTFQAVLKTDCNK